MSKRLVSGSLWFVAVWSLVELIESFAGLPRMLGPVLGAVAAVFVYLDPVGLFWRPGGRTPLATANHDRVGVSPVH